MLPSLPLARGAGDDGPSPDPATPTNPLLRIEPLGRSGVTSQASRRNLGGGKCHTPDRGRPRPAFHPHRPSCESPCRTAAEQRRMPLAGVATDAAACNEHAAASDLPACCGCTLSTTTSESSQRRRGLNLSHRATARGRCRTAACLYSTHETGEVVSTQATGTRQNVWDRWDVWKPHRIPSSVSRLKRQIGGWRHALGAASRCDAATLRRSVRLSTVSSARHEQAVCGMVCRRQKVSVDIAGPPVLLARPHFLSPSVVHPS